jgi:acylglycerol lipase
MTRTGAYVTNLELRESNPDGSEKEGLSHKAEGMFLLHVLEVAGVGEPKGSITILHGAGDHGARYEELAHALAAKGFAIALPDMRGHGKSEGPRGHSWGLKEVLRDVEAVQDHLAYRLPDAPRFLVGQGLGALYAASYTIEHPGSVAGLVLASPTLRASFRAPEKPKGLKGLFAKIGPLSVGALDMPAESRIGDAEQQRAWRADPLVHDAITQHTLDHLPASIERVRTGFARVDAPALVLVGDSDPFTSTDDVRAWCAQRPRTDLRVIAGAKHDLFHERGAADLGAAVAEWIAARVS